MSVDWFELAYTVLGGLCVFLFGMRALSESLQALASDFLRKVIGWLTTNRFMAVGVGLLVTSIIQSSSVTTVMVVGFVNAGLMSLVQAIGVILGANIGTTLTGWILALKIGKYGLLFLGVGLLPFFFVKNYKWRNVGKISIALGFVFLGLQFMSGGFKPLTRDPNFASYLTLFAADNVLSVIACVAVGCGLTFIVQSSSAMLGITIALATTAEVGQRPVITLATAMALVLGENIGTTVTAQLAAIGGNLVAKRAALAHTLFNAFGVTIMVIIFQPYYRFVEGVIGPAFDSLSHLYSAKSGSEQYAIIGYQIAAAHSLFNVTNVLFFLPLIGLLAKAVVWIRPDRGLRAKQRLKVLGPISQISPELALEQAEGEVRLMSKVTLDLLEKTKRYMTAEVEDTDLRAQINHSEEVTDNIQKEVTLFITTILQMPVSLAQSTRGYMLIRMADEIESVCDYCKAIAKYRERMLREQEQFSDAARDEVSGLMDKTIEFCSHAIAFIRNEGSIKVQSLVEQAGELRSDADRIRASHIERVRDGTCKALNALTFSDIIVAMRRIKNHSVNLIDAKVSRWQERSEGLRVLDVADVDDLDRIDRSSRDPRPVGGAAPEVTDPPVSGA
jgi:phosphate:Na+ symporter